jgi:hypothetical protein
LGFFVGAARNHTARLFLVFSRVRLFPVLLVLALSCTTYRDNLSRGERLYQENKFEDALALWRLMERDVDALSRGDQARYAYLRGMTDYRLGFRSDARHWLAIAKAVHEQEVGGLDATAHGTTKATLDELNREVYGLVPVDTASSASVSNLGEQPAPAPSSSAAGQPEQFCQVDADCSSGQVCVAERCTAP